MKTSHGETKWGPYKWIGGTDRQADLDIAGVQLDASQENSREHKLCFIPDARPGWGRLCGDSGDVFASTMVREVE